MTIILKLGSDVSMRALGGDKKVCREILLLWKLFIYYFTFVTNLNSKS